MTNEDLLDISSPPFPWDDLLYFQPVLPDDPLLQYDFDEDNTEKSNLAPFEVDSTPNQLMQRLVHLFTQNTGIHIILAHSYTIKWVFWASLIGYLCNIQKSVDFALKSMVA